MECIARCAAEAGGRPPGRRGFKLGLIMDALEDAFLEALLVPAALEDDLDFVLAFVFPLEDEPASLPEFELPFREGDKPPLRPIFPKFIILAGVTGEREGLYA